MGTLMSRTIADCNKYTVGENPSGKYTHKSQKTKNKEVGQPYIILL
jgi:hypothetical protein